MRKTHHKEVIEIETTEDAENILFYFFYILLLSAQCCGYTKCSACLNSY